MISTVPTTKTARPIPPNRSESDLVGVSATLPGMDASTPPAETSSLS